MAGDELVPSEGLAAFLKANLPRFSGGFQVERIGEGQSCLTFLVTGDGWEFVLRRPPRGDLPPSAFDVRREYRVMSALDKSASPIPVPRPLILCEEKEVIGANFYIMEKVEGQVVRRELPDYLSPPEERRRTSEELVDTLVELHEVDYQAVGLREFGKPGYLERQLERMNQLWSLAKFREIPEIDKVGAWLTENLPEQKEITIVHGDYKLDNVILAPQAPAEIVAVVDWEMSTLGDPLADLGWSLYFWRQPDDGAFGVASTSVTEQGGGFFNRREILHRYAEKSGRDVDKVLWYAALGGWKIAIIMEGSYRRFRIGGITDHPAFAALEQGVVQLARRAQMAADGNFGL